MHIYIDLAFTCVFYLIFFMPTLLPKQDKRRTCEAEVDVLAVEAVLRQAHVRVSHGADSERHQHVVLVHDELGTLAHRDAAGVVAGDGVGGDAQLLTRVVQAVVE